MNTTTTNTLTWVYHERENAWVAVSGRQVWSIYTDGAQFKVTGYPESPGVYRDSVAEAQAWCERREGELAAGPREVLSWDYDGDGQWSAMSAAHDDGLNFRWRVYVKQEGTFNVDWSEAELLAGVLPDPFATLAAAQSWCADRERELSAAPREAE